MLAIFSGADLYATTAVVASFMAGMGLGSLCGGALADTVMRRWQVGLFALAELLTGIFGLLSKWWYYDLLYHRFGHLASSPVLLGGVLFASLLLPTFCMGMTLPLLAKALTPAISRAASRIGSLYALNTLGAAAGALTTAWILTGRFDFETILQIGAEINFAIASLALVIDLLFLRRQEPFTMPSQINSDINEKAVRTNSSFTFSTWLFVYALSGFLALSLEIVWFRLLGVILKSNSFTFPHLLGVYLASLAFGIFIGSLVVKYVVRAAEMFLAMQAGVIIYSGLSIAGLTWGIDNFHKLQGLRDYVAGYNPIDVAVVRNEIEMWILGQSNWIPPFVSNRDFVRLYLKLPLALIAPATLLMGMSFPLLQKAVQNNPAWLGRRVGWLQASNIFGSTLGTILVGALFLEIFGTPWTLRLLVMFGVVFLFLSTKQVVRVSSHRRIAYAAACLITGVLVFLMPGSIDLWARLHGSPNEHVIATEGASGLSIMKNDNAEF